MHLLQATDLACERGGRTLFSGLNLQLPPGSISWLRGRNGGGKTSLLRLLAGLATPAAGQVRIAGRSLSQWGVAGRRHWAYVAHHNALKDDLTVLESLRFMARLHGLDDEPATLKAALSTLGMGRQSLAYVRTLSQGQRRRVALARLALCSNAPVWLLDEPFDALDTDGIAALNGLISAHARAGGCVLLTSHQTLATLDPPVTELQPHALSQPAALAA